MTEFQSNATKLAHNKLYQNYIEAFNRVSAELDTADRQNANSNNNNGSFDPLIFTVDGF